MVVMNIKLDNFLMFKNFNLNMSYPKKIVGSFIENEFIKDRPNFRYKKVNILMGANATGKTSVGKMLMAIFNFIDKRRYTSITDLICNTEQEAEFVIDFVADEPVLYRVQTHILPKKAERYTAEDIEVIVKSVVIGSKDSYETCVAKLDKMVTHSKKNYMEELEVVHQLSWLFEYPFDDIDSSRNMYTSKKMKNYHIILEKTLKTLDPAIIRVEKSGEMENTFLIRYKTNTVVLQSGKILNSDSLSSGTKEGIIMAGILASIIDGEYGFYYCDEKFSYIHSDVEKAILSVMVNKIKDNAQLFFTTHNTDILDLPLPKHSFTFLKKDKYDEKEPIKCISASALLKRNTDSLKHAVENDLFSVAPDIGGIFELANL